MTLTTARPARVLRVRGVLLTGAAGLTAAAVLAACGGGSSASTSAAGPKTVTATGAAAAPGQGGQGDGPGGAEMQKITECLTAAGISLPTPSGGPGGAPPSGAPSDGASGGPGGPGGGVTQGPDGKFTAPDGDVYTAMPTPGADGRGPGDGDGDGGFAQLFSDPQVAAALKACGLSVPTGRPTATATSS